MNKMEIVGTVAEATVVTHPAPHHGDEVMAMAIMALRFGDVKVLRTRNADTISEAKFDRVTMCDVGGAYDSECRLFDHHQRGFSEAREDGIKYSSAGLVWKEYGVQVLHAHFGCTKAQAEAAALKVDEMLIRGIDAIDNGQQTPNDGFMSVSQAISVLNPNWDEPATDEAFLDACQLAYTILIRTIKSCVAVVKGQDIVEEAIEASENGIIVLPQFIGGWVEAAVSSASPKAGGLLYGVFRNLQGQWNVQAIPPMGQPMAQRKPLPEAWRGLNGAALQEITGVVDAVFCHVGGFICGARSQEGALALARLAIAAK